MLFMFKRVSTFFCKIFLLDFYLIIFLLVKLIKCIVNTFSLSLLPISLFSLLKMGFNCVPCLWDSSSWIFTNLFRWRRVFCFRLHFFSAQWHSWCLLFLLFAQCWNISKQDWWSAGCPLHWVLLKVGLH